MSKTSLLTGKVRKTPLIVYGILLVVLLLLPQVGVSLYYIHILIGIFIYIIMTASLRLTNLSGQCSLGHAGFMCAGAYTSAIVSKNLGWSPWITIILGAALTMTLAFLVAIPFSRLRGIYFTMISLFFGMAVLAIHSLTQSITGGPSGMVGIPALLSSKIQYYYFFLGLMIVCLLIMYRIEFSRIGRTWKAVAQSYQVASSTGINETWQRIQSLAIGGLFAGLAGAGYAHFSVVLSQSNFSFLAGLYIFIYMMVGGINSFHGPILGTTVLLLAQALARDLTKFVPFILAAVLIIVLFVMPQGLAGLPEQIKVWVGKLRKTAAVVPEKEADSHVP